MNTEKQVMFKIVVISIVTALLTSLAISCSDDPASVNNSENDDPKQPVQFEVLNQHPHVSNCWLAGNPPDEYKVSDELSSFEMIITDEDEFESLFNCHEEVEEINFEEYFVLAGLGTLNPSCVEVKELDVVLLDEVVVLSVEIWPLDCAMPDVARYIVKVPAGYKDYPIEFDLYWGGPS